MAAQLFPRGGTLSPDSHGPAVVITSAAMLACSVILTIIRLHGRWPWTQFMGRSDFVVLAALLSAIASTAAACVSVQHGFGDSAKLIANDEIPMIKKSLLVSFLFFFLTITCGASAHALLLRKVLGSTSNGRSLYYIAGVSIMVGLGGMGWMMACLIGIDDASSMIIWSVFGALEGLIQLALFVASMNILWRLQMATRQKIGLTVWFSLWIPVVAVICVRLTQTPANFLGEGFAANDLALVVCAQIEQNMVIINASFPSLRSFLEKSSTGFLTYAFDADGYANSQKMISTTRSTVRTMKGARESIQLVDAIHNNTTTSRIERQDMEGRSIRSYGSDVIMVRRSIDQLHD